MEKIIDIKGKQYLRNDNLCFMNMSEDKLGRAWNELLGKINEYL